jgi:hypothetical protein
MPMRKRALIALLAACAAGCASPGVPVARHSVVPLAVGDLSVHQLGDTIIVGFTLPTIATDLQPLPEAPSIEIYRNSPQAAATASKRAKKRDAGRLVDTIPAEMLDQYRRNGRIEFPDKLDAAELNAPSGTQLVYSVRTRVSNAKLSADSNQAAIRVYRPPAAVQDLRVSLTETALVLNWSLAQQIAAAPGEGAARFEILRAEIDPATAQAAVTNPSEAKLVAPPALVAQTTETEYRDGNFQFGKAYLYTVREVEPFGNEPVESPDSAPAVIIAKDIFPPAAPQGVEAVSVAEANGAAVAIELTWTISTETDLAGYNVYRSDRADVPGQKLNGELLLTPTFRDISVQPGQDYFYRVAAVDQSGNESALSSAVETQVPEP